MTTTGRCCNVVTRDFKINVWMLKKLQYSSFCSHKTSAIRNQCEITMDAKRLFNVTSTMSLPSCVVGYVPRVLGVDYWLHIELGRKVLPEIRWHHSRMLSFLELFCFRCVWLAASGWQPRGPSCSEPPWRWLGAAKKTCSAAVEGF